MERSDPAHHQVRGKAPSEATQSHRTGNDAQRGLSPPCLRSNQAAINWCGQRESHPHGLSSIGSSGRRVYYFATSAKTGASTGTCALLAVLPRQSVAIYGLDAWSKRKDLHLRSPSGRRVYSALHLLLCHASKKWGLERDSHPRPSPYEGAALTAAPSSQMVGRLGNAPSSAA